MPMLDVQQQHATMFRLRFGDKTSSGAPKRLTDKIRVTSDNPAIVDAFTAVYGGERRQWGGAWEAYLPTTAIKVLLLPGSSLSQWWELYKGSVCERRCDSVIETKSGKPCLCPARDPETRNADPSQCSATTRVSVVCPYVDVVGAGMFVTHGLVAAAALPNSIRNAEAALAAGMYVPATVRIVEFVGKGRKYVVPQIEVVGTSLETLMRTALEAREANGGQLDGAAPKILGWSPPKPLEAGGEPVGSVREQMAAVEGPAPVSTRKNAQTPIPPTGIDPRPVHEAGDIGEPDDGIADAVVVDDAGPNRVAIAARKAGLDDDGRHALAHWASKGRTRSSKELTADEVASAVEAAEAVQRGEWRIVDDESGGKVLDTRFGFAQTPDVQVDPPEADARAQAAPFGWDELKAMSGPQLQEQLMAAGLPRGGKVQEIRERLAAHYGLGDEAF